MKKSIKTGLTGKESESTTMVGTQNSTINTVDVSSTDRVSEIPLDHSGIIELVNWFDSFIPENDTYEPNLKDLELTVNNVKREIGHFMGEVDDWFFELGQDMFGVNGSIYNDLMETSNSILDGLYSLQDDKDITRFDLGEVQNSLKVVQYFQSDCCEKLLKKKTMNDESVKRFLLTILEIELLLNQIDEKVRSRKVTKNFRDQIINKVCKCQSKLSELFIDIESILTNKLSLSDRFFYYDLLNSIICIQNIPTELFNHIFLSEEKGFETVEMEFLEIFDINEFDLGNYISVDTDESVLYN